MRVVMSAARGGVAAMQVTDGSSKASLTDVLFGDVWARPSKAPDYLPF